PKPKHKCSDKGFPQGQRRLRFPSFKIKLSMNHSLVANAAQRPPTKDVKLASCCQVRATKMSGRTDSKARRDGSAAVDGGRYTQGPNRSQLTLSKKIHRENPAQNSAIESSF
ncbi:hypothetical protein, partial [Roseibium marinum]|uniref:hypothetical protein n=1 Tax=Roseibium marinum TaxID=281252 RepID=UPI001AD8D4EF